MDIKTDYKIVMVAGEPSGDFLGGLLIKALKSIRGDASLSFHGVGGAHMKAQGLDSIIPLSELSIMGFAEVISRLPSVVKTYFKIKQHIIDLQPDIVVTIDFPGFNFFLGRALRRALGKTPIIHYVAPTVWAWKKKRAQKISKFLTEVLCLFAFEKPYFKKHHLPATFVGHPLIEMDLDKGDGHAFRTKHGISSNDTVYVLLPGSRHTELNRHIPVFLEMVDILKRTVPRLHIVIPTLDSILPEVKHLWKTDVPTVFLTDLSQKNLAYAAGNVAVAASGTIALELAAAGLPMVITYRVSSLSAWIAKRLLSIRYFCMVNILLRRRIVPELLQNDCTGSKLALESLKVLRNPQKRQQQKDAFKRVIGLLTPKDGVPSVVAAKAVWKYIPHPSKNTTEE